MKYSRAALWIFSAALFGLLFSLSSDVASKGGGRQPTNPGKKSPVVETYQYRSDSTRPRSQAYGDYREPSAPVAVAKLFKFESWSEATLNERSHPKEELKRPDGLSFKAYRVTVDGNAIFIKDSPGERAALQKTTEILSEYLVDWNITAIPVMDVKADAVLVDAVRKKWGKGNFADIVRSEDNLSRFIESSSTNQFVLFGHITGKSHADGRFVVRDRKNIEVWSVSLSSLAALSKRTGKEIQAHRGFMWVIPASNSCQIPPAKPSSRRGKPIDSCSECVLGVC